MGPRSRHTAQEGDVFCLLEMNVLWCEKCKSIPEQQILCCYSGIDLHFSHQSTFISRWQSTSPSWAVWCLRGPMVFILAYYCLYSWTWYLQVFGNWSQGWTRLVEVYNYFSEVLADFFRFSHDVKQRGLEIHPQENLQLTKITSISLPEASNAMTSFPGIFQAF